MDRLSAMQTFVRVVETGSFSAVAREQSTGQSTVSKQVAALESYLGSSLLIRSTRSLSLTEEGERYFTEARRLIGEIADAEAPLCHGGRHLRGWLRVASSVGFGGRVLMPHLHGFMRAHPDLKLDIKFHDGFIDLIEQGIDVAIRLGTLTDSALISRRLTTFPRVLVAAPSLMDRLETQGMMPRVPQDLSAAPCILYYTEHLRRSCWDFTSEDGSVVSVTVQGTLHTNSSEVVRLATLDGQGIAYAPLWLFEDALADGRVRMLLPDWQSPSVPIHLVTPPHRQESAKVRALMDYMIDAFHG